MVCEARERKKFEVWREQKQEQKQKDASGFNFRKDVNAEGQQMFSRLQQKLEAHIKALEDLKKKLSAATGEDEKARLRKEIEDLEKEIQGFEDTMDELLKFVQDAQRRTISTPTKEK